MLIRFEKLTASAWMRNPPGLIIRGQGSKVRWCVELTFGGLWAEMGHEVGGSLRGSLRGKDLRARDLLTNCSEEKPVREWRKHQKGKNQWKKGFQLKSKPLPDPWGALGYTLHLRVCINSGKRGGPSDPVLASHGWEVGRGGQLTPRHSQTCNSEYVDMFVAAPGAQGQASEEGHSCKQLVLRYTEACGTGGLHGEWAVNTAKGNPRGI